MSIYTTGIPLPGDLQSNSQLQFLNNFNQLNTWSNVNHYPITDAIPSGGKHKFVEMPVLGAIPGGLAANEGTFYTKTQATLGASTESTLFYTPDLSANEYQMTRTIASQAASFGNQSGSVADSTGGWTFLPGGLILQYGLYN